jgi:hypothetical protein
LCTCLLAGTITEVVDVAGVVKDVWDDDVIVGSRLGEVKNDDVEAPERGPIGGRGAIGTIVSEFLFGFRALRSRLVAFYSSSPIIDGKQARVSQGTALLFSLQGGGGKKLVPQKY